MNDNIILDEQLEEIEYFEILSLDEIIQDNPDFKAFSREEIYDELYNFFQNSNRAENLTDLFYKQRINTMANYVFISEATKENSIEPIEFVEKLSQYSRLQYPQSQNEKNKLFFALSYDINSQKIRVKPESKLLLELQNDNKASIYPVYETDDINVPVDAIYFQRPKSVLNDYVSSKILTKFEKSQKLNLVKSNNLSIKDVLKNVKPTIEDILKYLPDDDIDFQSIDSILQSFDTSLYEIDVKDFQKLQEHYGDIPSVKPEPVKYKEQKIKQYTSGNVKMDFVNRIQNILNLISKNENIDLDIIISQLDDERVNINFPGLIYTNQHDIANAVANNDMTIEDIIANIRDYKKIQTIENAIQTLKGIKSSQYDDIKGNIENLQSRILHSYNDLYDLTFHNFNQELKEIKIANDYSKYDGIPPIYNQDQNFVGIINREDDIAPNEDVIVKKSGAKILANSRYRNNNGFVEVMEIILDMFEKI